MFDTQTTALLRAVLDDVCRDETGTRTHVAAKILESARLGEATAENLRQVARKALGETPTMWR